jgi:diguanylate cyclase (GGDEF)-like protein
MLSLHSSTIAAMASIFALLLALCFYTFSRIVTERAVAERFALGNFLFGIGSVCRLMANEYGGMLPMYLTWLVLPCGLAVQYSAVRQMTGLLSQDRKLMTAMLIHAVALAVPAVMWKQQHLMGIPTLITSVALLVLLCCAYRALPGEVLKPVRRLMLATFSSMIILSLLQVIGRLVAGERSSDMPTIALSQFGFAIFLVIMNLGYIVTIMLMQQQLIGRLASADPLTSVLNRQGLESGLARLFRHGKKRLTGSVLLLNIDRFKSINDNLGHSSGDAVLRDLGIALRARMRKGDLLARTGGKEFCILLPGMHIAAAQVIAERMRLELGERKISTAKFDHINITVSIGVADFDITEPQLDSMFQRADVALYAAKANGRNRTEVWSPNLEAIMCAPRFRDSGRQAPDKQFKSTLYQETALANAGI